MKKILIIIILVCILPTMFAQNYIVFRVNGDVLYNKQQLEVGENVSSSIEILIDKDSELMLIDENNNKVITIKGYKEGKLIDVLNTNDVTLKDVTSKYVSYIKQKLSNKDNDRNYMQSAGTTYRKTDSISKQRLLELQK